MPPTFARPSVLASVPNQIIPVGSQAQKENAAD
jgi:hypothetical protein